MVKLFVGGIPEGVDSMRLRQLFSQFVIVDECDVIKDYAFVHVATEEHARIAIEKFDGYILEGKAINIRWSTSKLRKEPGMEKRCFRCGAVDHKTPHCPNDPQNHGSMKRPGSSTMEGGAPESKRLSAGACGAYGSKITIDLTGRSVEGGNFGPSQGRNSYAQSDQPQQTHANSTSEIDAIIPRPPDSDLGALYEEYIGSRIKYLYFRDRLIKELRVRTAVNVTSQFPVSFAHSTYYTSPSPSTTQNEPPVTPYASGGGGQHFYAYTVRK